VECDFTPSAFVSRAYFALSVSGALTDRRSQALLAPNYRWLDPQHRSKNERFWDDFVDPLTPLMSSDTLAQTRPSPLLQDAAVQSAIRPHHLSLCFDVKRVANLALETKRPGTMAEPCITYSNLNQK
jgi:hypothetical protein